MDVVHVQVTVLLEQHRDKLQALPLALLAHETLDEAAAYATAGLSHTEPLPAAAG